MLRLVVNPGTPNAWNIDLRAGITTLGRSDQNDYVIEHSSVSSAHCQITVAPGGILVKDLGSTTGTFLDGELVEEAPLKPGQLLAIGEIIMQFENDAALEQTVPGASGGAATTPDSVPAPTGFGRQPTPRPLVLPPAVVTHSARRFCKSHPRAIARFTCPKCRGVFCELCVNTRHEGNLSRKFCRACGCECQVVEFAPGGDEAAASFYRLLPGAFLYPFRGSGLVLLVAGTLFFFVLEYLPLLGLILTGYLFSYAKRIISSSAEGKTELPDWPDFSNWYEDIVLPYLQLLALTVLAFGPALILWVWHPGGGSSTRVVVLAALVFGALLAPMGMLALAMFDHVGVLNPISLAWSIQRVPVQYLAAAASFELVLFVRLLAPMLFYRILPVPFLPGIISGFLNLYFIVVGMRILGLLYVTNQDKLGWFRH